jgi:hypothetical protein
MAELQLRFPMFACTDNPGTMGKQSPRFITFTAEKVVHPEYKPSECILALFQSPEKAEMFISENRQHLDLKGGGVAFPDAAHLESALQKLKAKSEGDGQVWVAIDVVYWNHPFETELYRLETILEALGNRLQ